MQSTVTCCPAGELVIVLADSGKLIPASKVVPVPPAVAVNPGPRMMEFPEARVPTAKEMQDHERASTSVVAARRSVETRAFLEPSGALYDKLHISHDGYAGAVPIVHKSAAVSEVIAQLAIEADEDPE